MARRRPLVLTPPDTLRFVPQQEGHGDCAVASLAMLCGVDWPTAFAAFDDPAGVLATGATPWAEFRRAAARLGVPTRVKRRPDLTQDTGVLYCTDLDGPDGHAAFLWAGRIVDGDGRCYLTVADYLRLRQFATAQA